MRVHVYRNLQKKCWSVKDPSSGKVFNHVNNLHMHNVEFRVQPAGRDRVLKEKRKNVHAYVTGEWQTNFPYHAYVTGYGKLISSAIVVGITMVRLLITLTKLTISTGWRMKNQ